MLAHNSASRRQLPHHPQQPSYNQHGSIFNPSLPHQLPQLPQQPQTPLQPHSHSHSHSQSQSHSHSQSLNSSTLTPQSAFTTNNLPNNNNFDFEGDQILFDIQQPISFTSNRFQQQPPLRTLEYSSERIFQLPSHMQQPIQSNSLMSNGQLTPTSTSRQNHHRESSLSSFGSPAAPASPYAPSTLNPQVAGESYHDFQDFHPTASKTLTPAHTPLQENFFSSQYTHPNQYQNQNNIPFTMLNDGLPRLAGNELMSAPEIYHSQGSSRPSLATVASNDSPSTPPAYEDERQQFASHRTSPHQMPKLDRTMTDAYNDELFNPNISMISAPSTTPASTQTTSNLSNDIFTQRLQAANNGHLNTQREASVLSPRERSPFQPGSPLAPTPAGYNAHNMGFGTAKHMREQQKAKDDALAMQVQYERSNPGQVTPKTISPKDVNLVYNETEEDANNPLFPPPRSAQSKAGYRQQSSIDPEPSESEDMSLSQQSYASMATTRRESSSAISTNSQSTPTQSQFQSSSPIITRDNIRQVPQHYPFVPSTQRQASNISNMTNISNDFTPTLESMESSSSDYSPDQEIRRPCSTSADSGTYTCTYHGCTLRFETPAKLQKHKREGHRNSTSLINNMGGENRGGMTSMAQKLNSQSGPHKCERINPSTNKPCNTVFSRPYDLTRHEDTIHNAGKQKLRCKYCTEEKTFSRNDALTRHLRVVHPEIPATITKGKRRGLGLHSD